MDKTDPEGFCRAYWEAYMKGIFYDPANISRFHSDYYKFPNEMPNNVFFQISGIFQSIGEWDWRETMRNIRIPVLIIHGDHDTIPLEAAREWAALMPNARLLTISRAGHLPFVERPEIFYPAVDRFLKSDWPEEAEIIE